MKIEKKKLIFYKTESELELKIEATKRGLSLIRYIQEILELQAENLKKKRTLTL